ncbi:MULTISPECIES: NFACT family protein [unclassified Granulicatella]|uniref:Rqc2 family fibronectin-binding protein n=1 Tax=unclassified Granulicatella TaxID=2630493 RepID=UPI001073058D|nr:MULTISPECIES: NFACT RNA binding domain-containing protein [unclassified Granulicatella]MBF0779691.1 NFACT family protein [Granulicatella sp. 19428wC4_WM01]TFU96344.1 fibronectin/fibrinogen-binding protein [Granulicatella sp. WM01]
MSFDGFFTYHINNELSQTIVGGRVNKIYQPSDYEIVLTLRANRQNYKLLINTHPTQARYHLTEETFFNPEVAPNFCMLLRKYLEGATLKSIQQVGLDRITTFCFQNHDELGDNHAYHLTVELMGKHSNVFLIHPQSNVIIDCLKYIPTSKNSYRQIRANTYYQLPPYQNKVNIMALSHDDFKQLDSTIQMDTIQHTLQGIGQSTLQWIKNTLTDTQKPLSQVLMLLKQAPTQATLLLKDDIPYDFLPIFYPQGKTIPTLSHLLDIYYANKAKLERVKQLSGNLIAQLNQLISKNQKKLNKLQHECEEAKHADIFKIKGELLTTFAFQLEKGATQATLPNYYDNDAPLQITLNPQLSANQNAQAYFKKYQKTKQSLHFLKEQIALCQQEILYLDSVLVQIHLSDTQNLVAIKDELIATGYLKDKQKMKRKSPVKKAEPLQFKSSDGTRILVGRNNMQNDYLTLKMAKKDDIWLHTKDIPGSHVIIQSSQPSDDTIKLAATIAAYYSKYQKASNVPVDYVAVRQIKKPNGAKPGFVIYDKQKTIYVTPTQQEIDKHKLS